MSGVLVVAGAGVLREASRLGVDGILEIKVEQAILKGRKRKVGTPQERLVDLGAFHARVMKDGMTPQGRRRWRITQIERQRTTTNGRGTR